MRRNQNQILHRISRVSQTNNDKHDYQPYNTLLKSNNYQRKIINQSQQNNNTKKTNPVITNLRSELTNLKYEVSKLMLKKDQQNLETQKNKINISLPIQSIQSIPVSFTSRNDSMEFQFKQTSRIKQFQMQKSQSFKIKSQIEGLRTQLKLAYMREKQYLIQKSKLVDTIRKQQGKNWDEEIQLIKATYNNKIEEFKRQLYFLTQQKQKKSQQQIQNEKIIKDRQKKLKDMENQIQKKNIQLLQANNSQSYRYLLSKHAKLQQRMNEQTIQYHKIKKQLTATNVKLALKQQQIYDKNIKIQQDRRQTQQKINLIQKQCEQYKSDNLYQANQLKNLNMKISQLIKRGTQNGKELIVTNKKNEQQYLKNEIKHKQKIISNLYEDIRHLQSQLIHMNEYKASLKIMNNLIYELNQTKLKKQLRHLNLKYL